MDIHEMFTALKKNENFKINVEKILKKCENKIKNDKDLSWVYNIE